jgi:quinoprotein dehydrogenase-associated probable ABC transporter substrate-binding protein
MHPIRACIVLAAAICTPLALAGDDHAFRVCSDPNSLPFSNRDGGGFENQIAELLAADLQLPLEYTWFPLRRGFIRNTLSNKNPATGEYPCDVVMGLPDGFELAITTRPYYRSTYALVAPADGLLGKLQSADDLLRLTPDQRQGLRFGVFAETPGAVYLTKRGFAAQMVPYPALDGDPNSYPGRVIKEDLANGKVDAAIVWGPIAGYFARQMGGANATVIPLRSEPGIRFDYAIAMGVRFGDKDRKQQLEELLQRRGNEIQSILREFHVPLVDEKGQPL